MRTSILAFAACALVYVGGFGCGSNATKLDGGTDMAGGGADMTMTGPADMAKAPPGCFQVLNDFQNLMNKATPATKAKVNAFVDCFLNTCGSAMVVDGGNATKPCNSADGGANSVECDQCFSNIQIQMDIQFTDAMGNPLVCMPSNAPECGKCGTEIVACVLDCNTDMDCKDLTVNGAPATCMNGQCG